MAQDDKQAENRIARRHRVLKQGKILLANNLSVVSCTIRDMSETGARIVCGDQSAVPTGFRFVTPADNMIRDAEVAWRRGAEIGIRFTSGARRAPERKW